jgi:hypothetical protein
MPLAAKILAFLNVLVAGLFIYLAAIDWGERQAWSRATFLHELALRGLPVDERDTGWRPERPLSADIGEGDGSSIASDVFAQAGAKAPAAEAAGTLGEALLKGARPVTTQDREVERARAAAMKHIDAIEGEAAQRGAIKEILLALPRTFDEREELMDQKIANKGVSNEELKKVLDDRFEDALRDASAAGNREATDRNVLAKRRMIAHLLYNLSPDPAWHQRVMAVVGLERSVEEADSQAQELDRMRVRVNGAALDERNNFAAEYLRQRDRILILSQMVERQRVALKNLEDLHERQKTGLIAPLKERKVKLEKELDDQHADTKKVLTRQDELESQLFRIHSQIGELLTKNEKLERELRLMELGPVRGGQR